MKYKVTWTETVTHSFEKIVEAKNKEEAEEIALIEAEMIDEIGECFVETQDIEVTEN